MKTFFKFVGFGFAGLIALTIVLVIVSSVAGGGPETDEPDSAQSIQSSSDRDVKNATETPEPKPTKTPKPDPTATPKPKRTREQIKADYTTLSDVRELVARTGRMMGDKIVVTGAVYSIFETGESTYLGDNDPKEYSAQIQVFVETPDGDIEGIIVGFNGNTKGIYKGSVVTVWGTVVDTMSFTSDSGGEVTQPLLSAKYIEVDESSASTDVGANTQDNGYTRLNDIRELVVRTGQMTGEKVSFQGEVVALFDTGEKAYLGDSDPEGYSAQLQIAVLSPDGIYEGIIVGFNGDTAGIFKGSIITVYGTVVDTQSFVDMQGGYITQPLIAADRLEVD